MDALKEFLKFEWLKYLPQSSVKLAAMIVVIISVVATTFFWNGSIALRFLVFFMVWLMGIIVLYMFRPTTKENKQTKKSKLLEKRDQKSNMNMLYPFIMSVLVMAGLNVLIEIHSSSNSIKQPKPSNKEAGPVVTPTATPHQPHNPDKPRHGKKKHGLTPTPTPMPLVTETNISVHTTNNHVDWFLTWSELDETVSLMPADGQVHQKWIVERIPGQSNLVHIYTEGSKKLLAADDCGHMINPGTGHDSLKVKTAHEMSDLTSWYFEGDSVNGYKLYLYICAGEHQYFLNHFNEPSDSILSKINVGVDQYESKSGDEVWQFILPAGK